MKWDVQYNRKPFHHRQRTVFISFSAFRILSLYGWSKLSVYWKKSETNQQKRCFLQNFCSKLRPIDDGVYIRTAFLFIPRVFNLSYIQVLDVEQHELHLIYLYLNPKKHETNGRTGDSPPIKLLWISAKNDQIHTRIMHIILKK